MNIFFAKLLQTLGYSQDKILRSMSSNQEIIKMLFTKIPMKSDFINI
jgi:hypothetical protein